MTAAARRPLHVVAEPEDPIEAPSIAPAGVDVAEPETWEAQTVLNQWEPEHHLIGALMWMSAEQARPILELVPDTAIWRPTIRWAYELIRHLVDADTDPTPVAVLALGRSRPARDAIAPDSRPTEHRQRHLALYLFDAYSQAISPAAAIATYARQVLDEAYRRAFDTCGIRMQQLAACGAELQITIDLTEQFTLIRDELAELWRRCEAAAKPGWDTP
jgi:hypothetical protein